MTTAPSSFSLKQLDPMRAYFGHGHTLPVANRLKALTSLRRALEASEKAILHALHEDLGKNGTEAWMTELGLVRTELSHAIQYLPKWSRPRKVPTALFQFPAKSRIWPEPLGLGLIFSPWNYPFQLALNPLVAALAAGNCVVLKPSQKSPATAALIANLIAEALPPELALVVNANHDVATQLLKQPFDIIFYTGSTKVGRTVMEAAAPHLTPVCLELGGKSPAIVTKDANIPLAARRIAWGKMLNAGQTCIAPDYVWADAHIVPELMDCLKTSFSQMLGEDPLANPDYAHIVDTKAFDRLVALAPDLLQTNRKALKISPFPFVTTVDHPSMEEEIFGPLLPVLPYEHLEEALNYVRTHPKPLALYIFTTHTECANHVIRTVPAGGGCVNDVVMHVGSSHLPFGGVGASGMGRYHGKAGFDTFSNLKSILHQSSRLDLPMRYPPYTKWLRPLLHILMR